jgi:hypothetical protein
MANIIYPSKENEKMWKEVLQKFPKTKREKIQKEWINYVKSLTEEENKNDKHKQV